MLVPKELDESHHADVRAIADLLSDEPLRGRLRAAKSSKELYQSLLDGASASDSLEPRTAQGSR